ncbi:MAG: APC family permease [Thermoprotei archaeon]
MLSLKEAYGQAMAVTAPLGSVVSTSTAAVAYAGNAVVFATLLGLIGSVMWVATLSAYARRVASAGGFYTYGSFATRSKFVAFMESLVEVLAYSILNAVNALAAYLLLQVFSQLSGVELPGWLPWAILALTLVYPTLASLIEIKNLLGKIVAISASMEVALLLGLFVYSIATKGFQPSLFEMPKNVQLSNLGDAMILTIVSISGAGATTYLGEETKKPFKTLFYGMWLALLLGGISILLGTYAMVTLWGGSLQDFMNSPQPLLQEAIGMAPLFGLIVMLLSINSLLASNIGTTLGAARILFNLARERAAPLALTRTNKKGEPLVATLLVGALSATFTGIALGFTGDVESAFNEISVVVSVFWLAGRIIDAFGVPLMLFRLGQLNVYEPVVAIGSGVLNGIGLFLSFTSPDFFQTTFVAAAVAFGLAWYFLKARNSLVGKLVVDENNNVITMEEYLERLKAKVGASGKG